VGVTYIGGEVKGPKGKRRVKFLIYSGPTYSLLPLNVWRKIGLRPRRNVEFTLVDGTVIRR
jgi:predicted aspartyl protease